MTEMSRISRINNASSLRLSKTNNIEENKKKKKENEYKSLGYVPEEQQAIYKELRKQHED